MQHSITKQTTASQFSTSCSNDAPFAIDSTTGQLTVKPTALALDHETCGEYEVVITATESPGGATKTCAMTVSIADRNDPPVLV